MRFASAPSRKIKVSKTGSVSSKSSSFAPVDKLTFQTPRARGEVWTSPAGAYEITVQFDIDRIPIHATFCAFLERLEARAAESLGLPPGRKFPVLEGWPPSMNVLAFDGSPMFGEAVKLGKAFDISLLLEVQKIWVSSSGSWGFGLKVVECVLREPMQQEKSMNGFLDDVEEEVVEQQDDGEPLVDWFVDEL